MTWYHALLAVGALIFGVGLGALGVMGLVVYVFMKEFGR